MPTTISVFEFGNYTRTVNQHPAIATNPSIWDACMDALQTISYKSEQTDLSVASPGHWSNPGYNLGVGASTKKWKTAFKADPHIHLGKIDWRAVIGCNLVPAANNLTYVSMDIYIGECS